MAYPFTRNEVRATQDVDVIFHLTGRARRACRCSSSDCEK